jgi:hypothetical protein
MREKVGTTEIDGRCNPSKIKYITGIILNSIIPVIY